MVLLGKTGQPDLSSFAARRSGAGDAGDYRARLRQSGDRFDGARGVSTAGDHGRLRQPGGTEYANKLLVKAFGKEGATELLRQVTQAAR